MKTNFRYALLFAVLSSLLCEPAISAPLDRTVIVSYVSWYPMNGALNGNVGWKVGGYDYQYIKKSGRPLNTPLNSTAILSSAPKYGSNDFLSQEFENAKKAQAQMRSSGFDVVAFNMQPNPRFDLSQAVSPKNEPLTFYSSYFEWIKAASLTGMKVALFPDVRAYSGDYPKGYTLNASEWESVLYGAIKAIPNSNAVWKLDNRPVVIHFGTDRAMRYPPDRAAIYQDGGWKDIVRRVRARGVDFYYVADVRPHVFGNNVWASFSDAAHNFSPAAPKNFMDEGQRKFVDEIGIPYFWMSSPGYYRFGVAYTEPDFSRIHKAYSEAIKANASVMNVITWNDVEEDTDIQPSVNKGSVLLDVYSFYNEWFKTGRQPTPKSNKIYIAYPIHAVTDVSTKAPDWGNKGLWKSRDYSARVFYWANIVKPVEVDMPGVGKVRLPVGVSFGEIGSVNNTNIGIRLAGKNIALPSIRATSTTEGASPGQPGLQFRYVDISNYY